MCSCQNDRKGQTSVERTNWAGENYGVGVAGSKRKTHALSSTQQPQSEIFLLEKTWGTDRFYIHSRQDSGHTWLVETTQAEVTMKTYCNLSCGPSEVDRTTAKRKLTASRHV